MQSGADIIEFLLGMGHETMCGLGNFKPVAISIEGPAGGIFNVGGGSAELRFPFALIGSMFDSLGIPSVTDKSTMNERRLFICVGEYLNAQYAIFAIQYTLCKGVFSDLT